MTVLSIVILISIRDIGDHSKSELKYFDVLEFPLFFGICVFQFEGNTSCLQIENSMRSPKKFKAVSTTGITIVIIFKCTLALFAYLAFVETTKDIVIDSISDSQTRKALGLIYCGAIIGSFPIQMNPISDTIFRMTLLDNKVRIFRENPTTKYYLGAILGLCLCAGIALAIPNLHLMFNVAGSLMGIFTMTIFPVLFYNRVFTNEISWKRYILHWIMLVLITI